MVPAPPNLPEGARSAWTRLAAPGPTAGVFDPGTAANLPDPVVRWFARAIDPGTALAHRALITMHGEIRVGRWQPFTAQQVLSIPDGFVWAADAGRFPMRISGYDRYSEGAGEMRWRLFGRIPVMSAAGDDTTRSAAGRLAGEAMLVPTAPLALGLPWDAVDDRTATAAVEVGGRVHRVTVVVDDEGHLRSVSLPRWGDPDGRAHATHTFGVEMSAHRRFGPVTVPGELRAGWWFGTDRWAEGEFLRATIDRFELL